METSRLIISNHTSLFDFLIMVALHDDISFICRSSVLNVPFFGRVARKLDGLFIQPNAHGVSTQLKKKLNYPGPSIAVFPEATTTNGYYVITFKTGAFVPGVAVLPMTFEYDYKSFSPAFDSISWQIWLFRSLTEFYHSCTCTIHPLYYPSDKEMLNPSIYADNVQTFISDQLALPMYATSRFNQKVYYDFLQGKLTFNEAHEKIYNKDS